MTTTTTHAIWMLIKLTNNSQQVVKHRNEQRLHVFCFIDDVLCGFLFVFVCMWSQIKDRIHNHAQTQKNVWFRTLCYRK